ncbi:uncharacterized protein DNG_03272 [Cephalotrichum gorgonifer]|uniref:Gfd2/YDR514C-like C-terminal domain-containing protein n=1 Tax=Cephalotrichum gorgonifer TaxID=2041049 RepID=A0AAE8SU37_9PEZI|nr:uncharacterized protein DNG_03272 [Cephalotrichum gorgonifer]
MKFDNPSQRSGSKDDEGLLASMTGMVLGDEAPKEMEFCPWRMARPFFDNFHEYQDWDFYYLYSPDMRYTGPFLFVSVEQLTTFLGIINSHLDTQLAIPDAHAKRFSYQFGSGNTPCPKYLGKVHDANSRAKLLDEKSLPACGDEALKYGQAGAEARDKVRETLETIAKYGHAKKKKTPGAKQARNREKRRTMMMMLQDALGLRPWEEALADSKDQKFDVGKAPPFPPKNSPVLIAIDVEVHETCHDIITEVGFAILDTEKTKTTAPGDIGRGWWALVESKHLRVKEYSFHCNHKYVDGCPDRFDFGTSDFVSNKDLLQSIDDIFLEHATQTSSAGQIIERDIIFVGHDIGSDDRYLASIGCHMDTKNVVLRADSKDLYQHLRSADQGRALISVLLDLGIDSKNLHNAGNDAVYTLRATIACAIEGMKEYTKQQETHCAEDVAGDVRYVQSEEVQEKEVSELLEASEEEVPEKRDVTWVPGKSYYYADDCDDDNLPMII